MTKRLLLACLCLLLKNLHAQQIISNELYGQNAWVPTVFQVQTNPTLTLNYYATAGPNTCTYCNTAIGESLSGPTLGPLDNYWSIVNASGAKMVRVGGTDFNSPKPEKEWVYRWQVDKIKANGMIPVVQVGTGFKGLQENLFTVSQATFLVKYLNIDNPGSYCKYWIIGNEFDIRGYSVSDIYNKYAAFVPAMKAIDPNIVIIGPGLASYNPIYITGLTTGINSILPFIDIFSFHYYPFANQAAQASNIVGTYELDATRYNIMNILSGSNPVNFASGPIATKLDNILNSFTSIGKPIAITEANICYANDVGVGIGTNTVAGTDNSFSGNGSNGMLAGQFLAEMLAVGMKNNLKMLNFWSVAEGDGGNNYATDIGYIGTQTVGQKKPAYWHYEMVANNFTGTFQALPTINQPNVKAFAAKTGDHIAVMIMNQDQNTDYDFSVDLNGGNGGGSGTLKINFSNIITSSATPLFFANGTNTTTLEKIKKESTVLLLYDCIGFISQRRDYRLVDVIASSGTNAPITFTFGNPLITQTISVTGSPSVAVSTFGTFTFLPGPANGYTWTWLPPAPCATLPIGNIVNLYNCNTQTISTNYTFTVMDPKGCTSTQEFVITSIGFPVPDNLPPGPFYAYLSSVIPASCGLNNGGATFITNAAPGGNPFIYYSSSWDNGPYVAGTSTTGLSAGAHTVMIKQCQYNNSCTPNTYYFVVPMAPGTQPPNPTFTVNGICAGNPVCFNPATLSGTHSWTITNPQQLSNQVSPCFTLAAGVYTVVHLVNTPSCSSTYSQLITVFAPPAEVTATVSANNICAGQQSVLLTAGGFGAVSFTWNPGGIIGNPVVITPTVTTIYTVIAANINGCTGNAFITVNVGECCLKNEKQNPVIELGNVTIVAPGQSALTWNNLTNGQIYNGNIALPFPNYVISGRYNVTAGLTINTPVTFSVTEIAFGATVVTNQNATTNIDKSYWHGCSKMWQGIVSAKLLNVTNTVIEDAAYAIQVSAGGRVAYPGLNIDNTFFNKNFVGVLLNSNTITNFKITGTIFTSRDINPSVYPYSSGLRWNNLPAYNSSALSAYNTGLLKSSIYFSPTWRGQVGILLNTAQNLNGSGNIEIGDISNANNAQLTNVFDNIRLGVSSVFSKSALYNNLFQNIDYIPAVDFGNTSAGCYNYSASTSIGSNLNGNQAALYTNTFVNSGIGVYATQSGTLSVTNNKFINLTFAGTHVIQWYAKSSNTSSVNISKNIFDNCLYDLFAYDNSNINLTFNHNISAYTGTGMKRPKGIHAYVLELNKSKTVQYNISFNNSVGKTYGVLCANVYSAAILQNTLTIAPIFANSPQAAIWLQNTDESSIKANSINCNPSNSNNLTWLSAIIM